MLMLAIVAIPALATLLSLLPLGRRVGPAVTAAASLAVLVAATRLALEVAAGGRPVAAGGWLACEPLGALTVLIVALVGLGASLFTWIGPEELEDRDDPRLLRRYHAGHNLFLLSILSVPLLTDITMVWMAVALTTLLSAFLVSARGSAEALEAAWKYVVLTTLGATMALFGVLLLHWAARGAGATAFTWVEVEARATAMPGALLQVVALLSLLGFGTKIGLVPLHTWLAETYDQAPLSVCALLSGAEAAAVLYVLIRLTALLSRGPVAVGGWLIGSGLLSAGVAALLLIGAEAPRRLFAFSTIEHMGIILVAIGLGSEAGRLGALYQLVGHSLAKSLCFFAAGPGAVAAAGGVRLRGLVRRRPRAAVLVLAAGLAVSGVPPFALFIGELQIFRAGLSDGHYAVVGALALFVAVAFCAVMARISGMVFGEPDAPSSATAPSAPRLSALRSSASRWAAVVVVGVPLLVLGLHLPAPLKALLYAAAQGAGR